MIKMACWQVFAGKNFQKLFEHMNTSKSFLLFGVQMGWGPNMDAPSEIFD